MTSAARPQAALAEYLESRFGQGVNQPDRIPAPDVCCVDPFERLSILGLLSPTVHCSSVLVAVGSAVATGDLTRADAGSIGNSIETYVKSRDGLREG